MKTVSRPPRCAAIHDISGFGKCSLTVALPVLSACGVEVSCMPTAVLSTHTGGITGYTFRDLTEDMPAILKHWKSLDIPFDALYSGYLGSAEQAEIVTDIFNAFRTDQNIILVDPAMADNGKFYAMFDMSMARGMAKLCGMADVIVPNMTEAAFMLGEEYNPGPYTEDFLTGLSERLCALGAKKVVLTGVYHDDTALGASCYDASEGKLHVHLNARVPGAYHGTGDLFASVLLGGLLSGMPLPEASALAVDFTYESLHRSFLQDTDKRFGVDFEHGLWALGKRLHDYREENA